MKRYGRNLCCLLIVQAGCQAAAPVSVTPETGRKVLESLDVSGSGHVWYLGVRSATSLDEPWLLTHQPLVMPVPSDPALLQPVSSAQSGAGDSERAWRKYCHHQLEMSDEDHQLVHTRPMPQPLFHRGCDSTSLNK
jgi:hypothetical protein